MWLSLLAIFVVAFVHGRAEVENEVTSVFRKCCPKFQSLVKVNNDDIERYDCIDRDQSLITYDISVTSLVLGDNVLVEVGIPADCEDDILQQNKTINEIKDVCYDRKNLEVTNGTVTNTNSEIVALNCFSQTIEDSKEIPITRVQKCCPRGQSYDLSIHSCRNNNDNITEEWLISQLYPDSSDVYEVDYNVHCKNDEYAMEMDEKIFSLSVDGSELTSSRLDGRDQKVFLRGEWCADRSFGTGGLVARGCSRDCNKFGSFCLKKCCPVGQHFLPRRCGSKVSDCVPDNGEIFQLDFPFLFDQSLQSEYSLETVGIRYQLICPKGKFVLDRNNPADKHFLVPSGAMVQPVIRGRDATNDYCIENFDFRPCGGNVSLETLACFVEIVQHKNFSISLVAISISCVFLALTLVVYLSLAELRNLHGKTLICHVATMLLAFCCLARVQYDHVKNEDVCKLLGYGIYFGFVAAFSWLNVMCLDIWWTFGSIRSVQPFRKAGADRRRFAWYSLYAWSVAVLLTLATFLFDTYPVASVLDANMGKGVCWFAGNQNSENDWPHYIFFVVPMGVLTCVNFVLWVLTARHCNRVKSEVHRLQAGSAGDRAHKRFRADKARYLLTGKLWVVMGAGWVWEILSTIVTEPPWLWSVCDLINELQGVSIFLILVLKPKLYYLMRKKLGCSRIPMNTRLETPAAQKSSSTARTSSTFLSRSISADERTQLRTSQPPAAKLK